MHTSSLASKSIVPSVEVDLADGLKLVETLNMLMDSEMDISVNSLKGSIFDGIGLCQDMGGVRKG